MGERAILQLISSAGLYGAERVLLELAAYWREQGWRSRICVFAAPDQPPPAVFIEAQRLGLEPRRRNVKGQLDAAAVHRLGRLIAAERIDLVHSHGYKTDVFLALCRLPPSVCRVATCHTWYSRTVKLLAYELVDKLVLRSFDHVVVVAPQLAEQLLTAGMEPSRCSLIENGVSAPPPAPPEAVAALRTRFGLAAGEKLILRVGRLDADKGNDILLHALAPLLEAGRARLLLAGDGEGRPALEQFAKELRILERVIFAGYRSDVPDLLAAADLFVISSIKEGLPMVLLEAMAAGCPIVSTAVGAIPAVIDDGVEGRLVPAGEVAALRATLSELLEHPEQCRSLAARARERHLRQHSQHAMGERYRSLFEQLLARRKVAHQRRPLP